jgi:hypothetical protein
MLRVVTTALMTLMLVSCPKQVSKNQDLSIAYRPWVYDPLVKVCPTSPVTVDEVQWALDVWAKQGAPQLRAIDSLCYDTEFDRGSVIVDIPQQWMSAEWEYNMRALTVLFYDVPAGKPHLAYIGLPTADPRTLLHEVGHIWLDGHVEGRPHVLSLYIEDFAWDFDGVKTLFPR